MAQTSAQRLATRKYNAKTYKQIRIDPKIAEAEALYGHVYRTGESMTRFLVRAAFNQMERDRLEADDAGGHAANAGDASNAVEAVPADPNAPSS